MNILDFKPEPMRRDPNATYDPESLKRWEELVKQLDITPESKETVPIFISDIEEKGYTDYTNENTLNCKLSSDYMMITEYKNGDIVTISLDKVIIENPIGKLKKWWSTKESDKEYLKKLVDSQFIRV